MTASAGGSLLGVELVQEVVAATLLTGRVARAHPLSLMLIADPESGKSSIVLERPCELCLNLTDITATGLGLATQIAPNATHLIISEMSVLMAHGKKARDLLFGMLMPLLEEGLRQSATPRGFIDFKGARRGMIACVPPIIAADGRSWWHRSGLSTRILPFHYEYSGELVIRILAEIAADRGHQWEPGKTLVAPKIPIEVSIDPKMSNEIQSIAQRRAKMLGQKGIRMSKNYRVLVKAQALKRSWKNPQVSDEEIEWLKRVDAYVSWTEATLL